MQKLENKVAELPIRDANTPSFGVLVDQVEAHTDRLAELEELTSTVHNYSEFMNGIIQKQDKQITSLQNELLAVKSKAMKNFVTVTGVEEGEDVDPVLEAELFLKDRNPQICS